MMKNMKYMVLAFLGMVGFASCEKNEMSLYDTSHTAMNIWFGNSASVVDSITHNYSNYMGERAITFYAQITGLPTDYDRTFEIEAFEGDLSEAEGSFKTEVYTLKAHETRAECSMIFNTALLKDPNSFTRKDGHLNFRLKANDEFEPGTGEKSVMRVVLKNYLAKPDNWDDDVSYYNILSHYFGTYSAKKYQFILSVLEVADFKVEYGSAVTFDESTNTYGYTYFNTYIVPKVKIALEEFNSDPNNPDAPLRDESGQKVSFDN